MPKRHKWFHVDEDLRRDITVPRGQISRCRVCGLYRACHKTPDGWLTIYGRLKEPAVKKVPMCIPTKGPHQYNEEVDDAPPQAPRARTPT